MTPACQTKAHSVLVGNTVRMYMHILAKSYKFIKWILLNVTAHEPNPKIPVYNTVTVLCLEKINKDLNSVYI